jgi:hypothetical protein
VKRAHADPLYAGRALLAFRRGQPEDMAMVGSMLIVELIALLRERSLMPSLM